MAENGPFWARQRATQPVTKRSNWLAWSRLRQKSGIFELVSVAPKA